MKATHTIRSGAQAGQKARHIATHPRTGKALLETRGGHLSYEPYFNLSQIRTTAPAIPDPADPEDPPDMRDPWEPGDIDEDEDDD